MIKTQEELKDYLDNKQIKIYDRTIKNEYSFITKYIDNKSLVTIYKDITPTPLASIRGFPKISKQAQLPISDIDIILYAAIDETNNEFIYLNEPIDYHIYFFDEPEKEENKDKE